MANRRHDGRLIGASLNSITLLKEHITMPVKKSTSTAKTTTKARAATAEFVSFAPLDENPQLVMAEQPDAGVPPAEKLAARRAKRAKVGAATKVSAKATPAPAIKSASNTKRTTVKAAAKKAVAAKPTSPKRATAATAAQATRGGSRPLTIPKGYLTTRQLARDAKVSLPTAIKYSGKLKGHAVRAAKVGVEDSRVKTLYRQSAVKALQGLRDDGYGRRGRYQRA
jgi:cell envelope opacity-associated protein A